jgi:hypothetical protein
VKNTAFLTTELSDKWEEKINVAMTRQKNK